MAIALSHLKRKGRISTALVLDFDLHFGDGTDNILGDKDWVTLLNPEARQRDRYLAEVRQTLATSKADIIGVSAGFDNHLRDSGGLLTTEDYHQMGTMVRLASDGQRGGCFGVLERDITMTSWDRTCSHLLKVSLARNGQGRRKRTNEGNPLSFSV